MQDSPELKIGKRAFITTAGITFSLMVLSGILTRIIPSGSYERLTTGAGTAIVPGSFTYTEKVFLPVYKWFTAPIEVLFSASGPIVIVLTLLIIFIGGGYAILNRVGVFENIIAKIVGRFGGKRYLLVGAVSLVFMFFGSFLGMFEEIVPLVPLVVILSYTMGWDALLGLGMSLLAICFGFSVAVSNPYSVGVAQGLAGLPVFSGLPFRAAVFIFLYAVLCLFLVAYARRIERNPRRSPVYEEDRAMQSKYSRTVSPAGSPGKTAPGSGKGGKAVEKATAWFLACVGAILAVIITASLYRPFSDFSMPAIALIYLAAGIGAGFRGGLSRQEIGSTFARGVAGIAPGIALILMAMSVSFIISQGGVMDTVVYRASGMISGETPYLSAYVIYGLVLMMNFFIGSASAKAALLIPIITPLADLVGLTRQTMVLAYCFGDGFSNVLYPTNAILLISLGLTTVSYVKWVKWIFALQLIVLAVTGLFLAAAVLIGYGPF
jgi:uncharacterized ion transporter superfamily protein YfcC